MAKIWLDAGHGGSDSGAVANGLVEKVMNLVTTLACKFELERHGVIVGLTRTDDSTVDLDARASMANKWLADYFVSIHYNAGGGDGVEAIHSIFYGKGTDLANKVIARVHNEIGQNLRPNPSYSRPNSSGKTDYYAVIRETNMSAIIIEGAFIDSADYVIADTVSEQQKMGIAIAHGILDQLGIAIKPIQTYLSYTVVSGDSLWKISRKFGVTIDQIKSLNGLKSNLIRPGQTLKIKLQ